MPDAALPQPRTTPLPNVATLRREYRDALGRPLVGTVALTGKTGVKTGQLTVPPVSVTAKLVDGVLAVDLPPDTYTITSHRLHTAEGASVTVRDEVTVTT